MVRKLVLVGMLVIAGRGSAAQLFLGVLVSCTSLVLQVTLQPYKHWEDNVFKAAVELHIFLVVVCALVIKFLNTQTVHDEILDTGCCDYVLVGSFVVSVPMYGVCVDCVRQAQHDARGTAGAGCI